VKLIVGLGNPGTRYQGTRHNLGFDVVDAMAARWTIDMAREKFHALYGDGEVRGQRVVLLKPTTFMNRSGQAVLAAGRFYQVRCEDLLVVSDDLALPLGRIRMRPGGSAGCHNGLQDIIDRLGFSDFARLRLGIDPASGTASNYVLGKFSADAWPIVDRVVRTATDAVECWLEQGVTETMNRFNAAPEGD